MALNQSNPIQTNALLALFSNTQVQDEYHNDPHAWLSSFDLHDSSPQDITNAVTNLSSQNTVNNQTAIDNNVESTFNIDQGSVGQAAVSGLAGGGAPVFASVPPPPPPAPAGVNAAQYSLDYYLQQQTSVQDNDVSIVDDRDTTVDGSINQTLLAGDDIDQTFDNDIITASGDGAVAAGDDANGVATGAGAVAAGDDIEDTAINTGNFQGTQVGGDNDGDIQTVTGNVSGTVIGEIDESNVNFGDEAIVGADDIGAASFGNGNATSFGEDNDFDNVATGSGSVFDIDADGGDGDDGGDGGQGGNVNIGGNQSVNQSVNTDNSTNDSFNEDNDTTTTNTDSFNTDNSVNDSGNTDFNTEVTTTLEDSFNTDNSTENVDSFNSDVEANTDISTDTSVDIDAELEQTNQATTIDDSFNDSDVEDVEIEVED